MRSPAFVLVSNFASKVVLVGSLDFRSNFLLLVLWCVFTTYIAETVWVINTTPSTAAHDEQWPQKFLMLNLWRLVCDEWRLYYAAHTNDLVLDSNSNNLLQYHVQVTYTHTAVIHKKISGPQKVVLGRQEKAWTRLALSTPKIYHCSSKLIVIFLVLCKIVSCVFCENHEFAMCFTAIRYIIYLYLL